MRDLDDRAQGLAQAIERTRVPAAVSASVVTSPARISTAVVATTPRGGGLLARFYDADPRAAGLGGVVALGGVAAAFLEKGRPLPAAVAANEGLRRTHADLVARTLTENGRALAAYRVTVRISEETP